jgi:flagellar biosynthesis protein FlhA
VAVQCNAKATAGLAPRRLISGGVKVGLFITAVNIIGGISIGTKIHGETLNQAIQTYLPLAIGDGIVYMLPLFFIQVAAGIIVRRSFDEQDTGMINLYY